MEAQYMDYLEKDIHFLIDGKVLTPHLIYSDETHLPYPYAIFQFIDGVQISKVSGKYQKPLSYELGKSLASIHSFKFQNAGLFGEGIKIAKTFDVGSSPTLKRPFMFYQMECMFESG